MHHRKEKADHQQTLCCILIVYNVKKYALRTVSRLYECDHLLS